MACKKRKMGDGGVVSASTGSSGPERRYINRGYSGKDKRAIDAMKRAEKAPSEDDSVAVPSSRGEYVVPKSRTTFADGGCVKPNGKYR